MKIHAHTLQDVGEYGFRTVDTLHVYASADSLKLLARFILDAADQLEKNPDFGHLHVTDHFHQEWPDEAPEIIVLDPGAT